eukprot:scaffold32569_cov112-Isochrysis_galbana.AAC.3
MLCVRPRLDPPSRPRAATGDAKPGTRAAAGSVLTVTAALPPHQWRRGGRRAAPPRSGLPPPAVSSTSIRSGRPSPPPTSPAAPLPSHLAPSRAPTPEAFTAAVAVDESRHKRELRAISAERSMLAAARPRHSQAGRYAVDLQSGTNSEARVPNHAPEAEPAREQPRPKGGQEEQHTAHT